MDIRYTFIGGADCFGFVPGACDVVLHQYKEKEDHKPVDTERFVVYVETKLVPELGNFLNCEPHRVVIMDNCSIHLDPQQHLSKLLVQLSYTRLHIVLRLFQLNICFINGNLFLNVTALNLI